MPVEARCILNVAVQAHGKLQHGHIEELDSLLKEQVASKLEQLQSSLTALQQQTATTSSSQLEMLKQQKTELAAAATAHKQKYF